MRSLSPLNRIPYWAFLVVLFLFAGCGRSAIRDDTRARIPGRRPNIVLIIVDTLRADKMSCYGFGEQTTPELDELAARGVRFERVIAPSSWTRPSIAAMLTSRYPRTLGIYSEQGDSLDDRFLTLAEILQENGYSTLGMTANPNINTHFNFHQGFDFYFDSHVLFQFMNPGSRRNSYDHTPLVPARRMFADTIAPISKEVTFPWYLQFNIMEMHEYYRGHASLTRPEFRSLFNKSKTAPYLQALRQVSKDVHEFIQFFSILPGWEDTLFIITSDHGEGLDDHPDVERSTDHGYLLYESQVMVPMIFFNPGHRFPIPVVERPVRLLDLLPTILDYVRIDAPAAIEGRSLLALMEGGEPEIDLPEQFVTETQFRDADKIGLYNRDWKYIDNRDGWRGVNRHELQPKGDLENGRVTDRAGARSESVAVMRALLDDWENRHRKVAPTPMSRPLSREEEEQLRALSYLQ